ncbi:LptF/LptG family permease [Fodinibius sp.]|uniref:LptF/LptG family permease n=1 Tax=Fodinibius sp. TaxID=1872440 RepID=UPI002ACD24C5|nr:LptF/LptG family permease [Fodinibius sp.]
MIVKKPTSKAEKGRLASKQSGQTLTLFLHDGSVLRKLDRRQKGQLVDVFEETHFDRYRISFDLSDLAFSRSNPADRSRNDRTMNIQAMSSVVDSLNNQIDEQKKHIIKNKNYIYPTLTKLNTGKNKESELTQSDSDTTDIPYESKYLALQQLHSKSAQLRLHDIGLMKLRNYKSFIEDVVSDTEWRHEKIAQYLVEIHKKFSIPIACIVFVLLGAPIGMYTKKGNLGYAALIGTVFLTFYWISIIQGEKMADRLFISPFTGMWLSDIVLGAIGLMMVISISTPFKLSKPWSQRD